MARSLAVGCAAVLVAINVAIWQKQDLISHSRAVYVELAPLDPRSLMQGDFMRLRFRLPPGRESSRSTPDALFAVGTIDQRGILTLVRYHNGTPIGPHEMLIGLVEKHGQVQLVTDAWYFEEGTAAQWAKARFGEFRVDAKGKALLVGLRDPNLEPL